MNADQDQGREPEQPEAPKQAWTAPTLHRLNTADAEVGTRFTSDGTFTTS